MKVKDLIDFLKRVDPKLKVYIADWNEGYKPARELIESEICVDKHRVKLGLD